ncbi:uncharacterized protein LOC106181414 [Lingula anatina]|uniref:Uncharacterized protein LOC106181414 n=1 Tax=Lingula anatina TaxID=7574 RepID=A0A1S3KG84_LINAN|nr:uncharacterized protein LOC106181414 [Lingula anatina]|eukprot:XP_013421241.1 uncharacterized protein LOC106181414 [Lingula anatina]
MAAIEGFVDIIRDLVKNFKTNEEISSILKTQYGVLRGASVRSIKTICSKYNIRRSYVTPTEVVANEVAKAIGEVGTTYGRKMMTGYLRSKGIKAGETRVGKVLREENPNHQRRQVSKNLNPIPYQAAYFRHKMHIDQNEKLVMFGVTHVLARDGFSGKIVSHATMAVKNNLTIYEEVYKPAVKIYGIFDQVRVDHGKEFYLTLFMQEENADIRINQERTPYLQTSSKYNHTIERIWPEVNKRVNYPFKNAMIELVETEKISLDNNVHRYCMSTLLVSLCSIGVQRVVDAWNEHRIPGKGVPNEIASREAWAPVADPQRFPSKEVAAERYRARTGTTLKEFSHFARDPFPSPTERDAVQTAFNSSFPDLNQLCNSVCSGHFVPFQDALLKFIELTEQHS